MYLAVIFVNNCDNIGPDRVSGSMARWVNGWHGWVDGWLGG